MAGAPVALVARVFFDENSKGCAFPAYMKAGTKIRATIAAPKEVTLANGAPRTQTRAASRRDTTATRAVRRSVSRGGS
jgi:hypothetical protein